MKKLFLLTISALLMLVLVGCSSSSSSTDTSTSSDTETTDTADTNYQEEIIGKWTTGTDATTEATQTIYDFQDGGTYTMSVADTSSNGDVTATENSGLYTLEEDVLTLTPEVDQEVTETGDTSSNTSQETADTAEAASDAEEVYTISISGQTMTLTNDTTNEKLELTKTNS